MPGPDDHDIDVLMAGGQFTRSDDDRLVRIPPDQITIVETPTGIAYEWRVPDG